MYSRTHPGKTLSEMYNRSICFIHSPASVTKCHRVPVHHIRIELSIILQIPFRLVLHGIVKNFGVMQYGPKKKVKTKIRPRNCLYWPCTTEQDCPFGNVVTIIFIIISSHVGKSLLIRYIGTDDDDKDVPRGNITCHRIDSLTIALIYGRERRSSKSGRRCGPTTASISACAFLWASGYSAMAKNRACTADVV